MFLSLTSSGKRNAKNISLRGAEFRMVSALDENGPSEIGELAKDMRVDLKTVRAVAVRLVERGLIKKEE